MSLQELASRARGALGGNHPVIRILRPVYETGLDLLTLGRGYRRTVNGLDTFYLHPRARGLVPEVYEPTVYAFLRQAVRSGSVAFNVGAHVGIYALLLGRQVGASGRVVAFEPNPATRRLLASHVRRNRLQDRVSIRAEAVANRPGRMPFVATGIEGYSRLRAPHPEAATTTHRTIETPVTTIDAVADGGSAPDLVVVDVEGFEGDVLVGAAASLRTPAEFVVEMHPEVWPAGEADRIRALLLAAGRRAESLTGASDPYAEHNVARLVPA